MSMAIIARTNKATIYQDVDGSVVKQYHTRDAAERVLKDERSLGHMSRALGKSRGADGWRYTVVGPLRADPSTGTIWLEAAAGQAVFALEPSALFDAEYHVGVWLATYHNHLIGDADEGLVFADATVHNIFVDLAGKTVTAFDPGSAWGKVGNPYQDVIYHVYSLVVVLLIRRCGSLGTVRSFLHGYASATTMRMTVGAYATALRREARRQWAAYGSKSKAKQLAFAAGSVLLALLFTIYVPVVLARAINSGRDH